MPNTIDYLSKINNIYSKIENNFPHIEQQLNSLQNEITNLSNYTISLERKNFHLKKALKLFAKNIALNENGKSEIELTQEESEFIKKTCIDHDVFVIQQDKTPAHESQFENEFLEQQNFSQSED